MAAFSALNSDITALDTSSFKYYSANDIVTANKVFLGCVANVGGTLSDCPSNNGILVSFGKGSVGVQLYAGYQNGGLWYRNITNNAKESWVKIS